MLLLILLFATMKFFPVSLGKKTRVLLHDAVVKKKKRPPFVSLVEVLLNYELVTLKLTGHPTTLCLHALPSLISGEDDCMHVGFASRSDSQP